MSYIWEKYGIYLAKTFHFIGLRLEVILRVILDKIMGYIGQKLWDIPWDIFVKSYGIYLTKMRGIFGKTMGCIIG